MTSGSKLLPTGLCWPGVTQPLPRTGLGFPATPTGDLWSILSSDPFCGASDEQCGLWGE